VATADARLSLALSLVQAAGRHALAGAERCQVEWNDEGERVTDVDREAVSIGILAAARRARPDLAARSASGCCVT
jgi:hypothetical protein